MNPLLEIQKCSRCSLSMEKKRRHVKTKPVCQRCQNKVKLLRTRCKWCGHTKTTKCLKVCDKAMIRHNLDERVYKASLE